jgi:DNA-directed RNA polymerase specialized sigma24 family protein
MMVEQRRSELLSLAFLLTGDADVSVAAVAEMRNGGGFFDDWMEAWARRVAVSKALSGVHSQLAASIARTRQAARRDAADRSCLSSPPGADRGVTEAQLRDALFALDLFPRCALVLAVYEGMPFADVAVLLGVEEKFLMTVLAVSARELARNLALESSVAAA